MGLADEIEDDFDAYMAIDVPTGEIPEGTDPAEAPVVAPDSEDLAERLLYRARKLTEEKAEVEALGRRKRAEIDYWERDRVGGIVHQIERVSSSLEAYARRWVREHPKRPKTIKLVNGTLSLKASGRGRILVTDEYLFIDWAKTNRPDLLRWEPKVKKADLANEDIASRHEGPQINDDRGELVQSYRLMVEVEGDPPVDPAGTATKERVSVPGVVYVEPLEDRFSMSLPKPNHKEEA